MVAVRCYAKINFVLDVLHKRPDGYHELAMVMQSVSLADTLHLKTTPAPGIILKTKKEITASHSENLIYKACQTLFSKYPQNQGVEVTLEKNIPLAAGLAGGSADCAGTLHGLNKLFQLGLSLAELTDLANTLGSDIAFCLRGGTALAEGRGDKITLLPPVPLSYGLLLKPPFPLSTASVYSAIPRSYTGERSQAKLESFQKGLPALSQDCLHNDLYTFAQTIKPQLSDYLNQIKKTGPTAYQMSGSGPTIFAFYSNRIQRDKAYQLLQKEEVYPIETVTKGFELLS